MLIKAGKIFKVFKKTFNWKAGKVSQNIWNINNTWTTFKHINI